MATSNSFSAPSPPIFTGENYHAWAVKMKAYLRVDETIFTRIMACKTAKQVWDKLKIEFQGSEKTKQMQIFNLRKEFELLKRKETENVKEYIDRVMKLLIG
ncbi:UNVERIFIED_CONTAM: hypothetical protein Sradi_6224700 [Sesamum radiatum]|uniref:DUF4219 domain-containing protein n=1 Tax=Sesamum radiatum TaxID=300843 RepID=A0AAW2KBR6_SESRA